MRTFRVAIFGAFAVVAAAFVLTRLPAPPRPALQPRSGPPLQSVVTWGYQLQGARAGLIAPEIDLVVIDHAREQSATDVLTAADVEVFRQRPGKSPRIVLAYMSIGEAERYRYYWSKTWTASSWLGAGRPTWLGRENKDWKGNYHILYWLPDWQKIIFNPAPSRLDVLRSAWLKTPDAYIDRILDAGFDGVYLDRVDAFGEWEKSRKTAEQDMSDFVVRLSGYAKARRPGFLVVPQNGEELTRRVNYRRAIDGLAKEDLMFGVDGPERDNKPDEIAEAVLQLQRVRADNLPVFVVEYITDAAKRQRAQRRMAQLGFVLTFAERDLHSEPTVMPPLPPVAAPADTALPPPANTRSPQR